MSYKSAIVVAWVRLIKARCETFMCCLQSLFNKGTGSWGVLIATPIMYLLGLCSPTAIRRFVIAVVINSIKRPVDGLWPHILQEVLKRRAPAFTHCNSTPAIAKPITTFGISTTLDHRRPGAILRRFVSDTVVPVAQAFLTTATSGVSTPQIIALCHRLIAAVATANPPDFPAFFRCFSNDGKQSKSVGSKVEFGWHFYPYFNTNPYIWERTA